MNKMNFTPFPTLWAERLCLRQITDRDLEEYFVLKSDERLLKGYDAKAKTYEESKQFLHKLNEGVRQNKWIIWGIVLKETDKLIGSICLWNISEDQSSAEVGYELMYEWQGKGIMDEAIKEVIHYGFCEMKLRLIEALPNPDNIKSVRVLEKKHFVKGESFMDTDPENGKVLPRVFYLLKNDVE